jgi:glutamate N-acetyltransferase/amino-acid N-acetyltransferase
MATMLAFVATDVDVDAASLRSAIGPVAAGSFNAIHVDSHASTNDSFVLLATGASGPPDEVAGQAAPWSRALERVARRLAWLIVRDGEGATKVTRIRVTGAPGPEAAADVARRIARSALVRTALFGNDPNWGRFVSAAGTSPHVADASRMRCVLQGTPVFDRGQPLELDAAALGRTMAAEEVELVLDLGSGAAEAEVLTSDLGYRYVEINAEYTT